MNVIQNAIHLISSFSEEFEKNGIKSNSELKLKQYIDDTLKSLKNYHVVNNKVYITLEKFYQSSSMMIGLSNITLNTSAKNAWRNYDKFHYEYVKPNLKLYGNTLIL